MTDDLVKRLREKSSDQYLHNLLDDAADRIEELMKYKSLHAGCDKASLDIEQKLVNQLSVAHKRIEALEAALQPFADPCIEHCSERCESECDSMEECPCFIARATLAGEKKDE